MRIVFVTGIFPPDIGGPATYVPEMASELVNRGHAVTVVTTSAQTTATDDYPFAVVRIKRTLPLPLRWLKTLGALISRGRQADVLLVNGLGFESAVANLFLRKRFVQKIVGDLAWERATNKGWTTEDFEAFQKHRQAPRVQAMKVLRSWWIRQSSHIIANSEYMAGVARGWGYTGPIEVIRNTVVIPPIEDSAFPLATGLGVVTVGRLVPWKGVDLLIRAIARSEDIGLVVVGDGEEREALSDLATSLGVGERVHFCGRLTKPQTLSMIAASDIFALASTWESFPHAVVEAMGIGKPVVATAVGGTSELVRDGENGYLVSPDVEEIEEAFRRLRDGALRQRLGAAAAAIVREQFQEGKAAMDTERVLAGPDFQ